MKVVFKKQLTTKKTSHAQDARGRGGRGVLVPRVSSLSVPLFPFPRRLWLSSSSMFPSRCSPLCSAPFHPTSSGSWQWWGGAAGIGRRRRPPVGLCPPADMVVVALSPSSLLPVSTPANSCSQGQLECCRGGGPRHPGGAVMVGVFAALPVPRQSSSSCCGPVVPLSVAPLSAPRAWLAAVVGGAVSPVCRTGAVTVPSLSLSLLLA